jgi:hypothetical protein
MRRLIVITVLVLAFGAATASGTTTSPAVLVTSKAPLTVRGLHFRPGERVTVTLLMRGPRTAVRRTAATATGGFRATFATVSVGDCDSFAVRAVGNLGSRASYKPPRPVCGAQLQPIDG